MWRSHGMSRFSAETIHPKMLYAMCVKNEEQMGFFCVVVCSQIENIHKCSRVYLLLIHIEASIINENEWPYKIQAIAVVAWTLSSEKSTKKKSKNKFEKYNEYVRDKIIVHIMKRGKKSIEIWKVNAHMWTCKIRNKNKTVSACLRVHERIHTITLALQGG